MAQLDLFKDNSNAPRINFMKMNGRIIPIVNKHRVLKAAPLVEDRLNEMKTEVQHAQSAGRLFKETFHGTHHVGAFSTYPEFYRSIKFKNKADFKKASETLSGRKGEALVEQAIDDLKGGYDSPAGRVPPNLGFRVLTKQTYDNTNVIFRRIHGKIRPIRVKTNRHSTVSADEVPF